MRKTIVVLGIGVALLSALPALGASSDVAPTSDTFLRAKVIDVLPQPAQADGSIDEKVDLESVDGANAGQTLSIDNTVVPGQDDTVLSPGETVVIERLQKSDGTVDYQLKEKYRIPGMIALVVFFLLLAFVVGGKRGLTSLLGLGVSIAILLLLIIPWIIRGGDPFMVSLIGAVLIACTSLYLAHGFNKRTSIAFLSTITTLALAAILDVIFVHVAKLFGMGSDESLYLQMGALQNVNLRGLLLGGIIIGCLGVLDDITTAQTATIDEVSKANPSLTAKELRAAGKSVGGEHIASLINTLALAYVGASMPLLLLLETSTDFPLWVTLNGEFLAEEIIRTLVGSSTLLLAVPIATWLAAHFFRGGRGSSSRSDSSHVHSFHHH
jgi:uncharacterized membrane protein